MTNPLDINTKIANNFYQKSKMLSEKGDKHKFRAISYYKGAKAIEQLDKGLDEIYQHGWLVGLQKIKGIGNRLAHDIETELKKSNLIKSKK
ncbi:MAG: helix-hairpin-helix domain-containing protein [Candidatus Kerfeldbacteria bacterium]|jgi:DNA polymerase/3'-5' exonuclease PolX